MTYKEDMKFQIHLSLWDWQSSGVSARNRFRRSMAPNLISTLLKNAQSYKHRKFQANYCAWLNKKISLSNFYLFMFLARLKTHLEGFIHLFSFYRRIKKKTTSVRVELTILRLTVARLNQLGHEVIIWFLNFRSQKWDRELLILLTPKIIANSSKHPGMTLKAPSIKR